MISVIIIDDEVNARKNIRNLLTKYCPDVLVLAEADSVKSGAKAILDHEPDLIFLDIDLSDGTGFDLLEIFSEPEFKVVFVTAYDQFAIRAIKFSALDYILKPTDYLELREAVKKAISSPKAEAPATDLALLAENHRLGPEQQKIAIPTLYGIELVQISDILYIESDNNYSTLHFEHEEKFVASRPIKLFDELLAPYDFLRVYKSHLVNLNHIRRFVKGRGGHLEMVDGASIPVSRGKKAEVLAWLNPI